MKFCDLYLSMSGEERRAFADKLGKSPAYLWQIAKRWNGRRPSLDLMVKLCKADGRLKVKDLVEEFSA